MAIIRGDSFDSAAAKSDGEKQVLNALATSKDTDGWIVMHSLDVLHNQYRTQGEADFVLLIPGYGVMVIEVKDSHSVERLASGQWKVGGEVAKRGSPFVQAKESMWNIRNYLDKKGFDSSGIPFVYAVWFTKVISSKFGDSIEWKDSQILGAEHLAESVPKAIKSHFKDLIGHRSTSRATAAELSKIANFIRPVVPKDANPLDRQKLLTKHLDQALEQQKKLFALFSSVKAYVVQGLAGTGKTYLAVAEAQKSHIRGEPALLLCYNSLLAADLKKRLIEYPYVRVSTIHGLMREILGEDFEIEDSPDYWTKILPKAAIEKLLTSSERPKYQTLILDEAQDQGLPEYLDFLDLMLYDGLKDSKVVLFGDFTNQAIFNAGNDALAAFKSRIPALVVPDPLTVNCRNTAQVGEFVADYVEPDPAYTEFMRNDPTTGVVPYPLPDGADPKAYLQKAIDTERKQFPPNSIVILSSQKEKLKKLLDSMPGNFRQFHEKVDSACLYGSIQQYKGLEAASIILVEFEGGGGSVRDHFYVASTRATANFTFIVPMQQLAQISESN